MFELHLLEVESLGTFRIDLVLHVNALEREVSKEHPEEQHSHRPHIHLVVVYHLLEDLGSHVGRGPTKSVDVLVILAAKTEIAYLYGISVGLTFGRVRKQENVLSLDVPVNEIFEVYRSQT